LIPGLFNLNTANTRLDAVLILVSAAFIAVLGIGAWIGYTIATTPPPKPVEEITGEIQKETETENQSTTS
jgi:predicted DNA-binding transcriptional regulator